MEKYKILWLNECEMKLKVDRLVQWNLTNATTFGTTFFGLNFEVVLILKLLRTCTHT